MADPMRVYEAPTGWVASSNHLASRAPTREEAIEAHRRTLEMVRRLADQWYVRHPEVTSGTREEGT
jgi:hypothetical protein